MSEVNISRALQEIRNRAAERLSDSEMQGKLVELESRIAAMEKGERLYYRRAALLKARVPEAAWPFLDAPSPTAALNAAASFLNADDLFLTLAGPKGRGKTVAISMALEKAGGRYFLAQEIVQTSSFDRKIWDDLAALPLLGLDDLGSERGSDEFDANLYALLDARYRRLRKTIIGTNFGARDFAARYASGGLSRLYERLTTSGAWVNLPGASMRKAAP